MGVWAGFCDWKGAIPLLVVTFAAVAGAAEDVEVLVFGAASGDVGGVVGGEVGAGVWWCVPAWAPVTMLCAVCCDGCCSSLAFAVGVVAAVGGAAAAVGQGPAFEAGAFGHGCLRTW